MTDPPLKQMGARLDLVRSLGRYSWNPDIPEVEDHAYWARFATSAAPPGPRLFLPRAPYFFSFAASFFLIFFSSCLYFPRAFRAPIIAPRTFFDRK